MELLQPACPPHYNPAQDNHPGLVSPVGLRALSTRLPEIVEEGATATNNNSGKVYVAVGKSVEKTVSLLHWAFKRFGATRIHLLHVHKPSPVIPTLLGKLPASQANCEVVSAFRREEREKTKKLLGQYRVICHKAKVEANVISIEDDQIHRGIVELVKRHGVQRLVMGAAPEICMKLKKSPSKVNYTVKNAPLFCTIWFINKGKHVWTREASERLCPWTPFGHEEDASNEISGSRYGKSKLASHLLSLRSDSATRMTYATISGWIQSESICVEETVQPNFPSSANSCSPHSLQRLISSPGAHSGSGCTSVETRSSSDSVLNAGEDSSYRQLGEVDIESEISRNKALEELLKRRKLESEAMEAISKVMLFESAHAHEVKLRKEAEDSLINILQVQEKVLEQKEKVNSELQKAMRNIALLDSRAVEANRRHEEASGELKLIQASIASLWPEKQRIQRQKMEATRWLERWRNRGQAVAANCNGFLEFVEEMPELAEFSLSDIETATCNFSESFKLGQGGYGCVYKGEMFGRTVVIKKLCPNNRQGQSEFQKEVQILGKLQHPHLVTLLGSCPEAWSLVYEYLPNGSLQDRLFEKSSISPLTWKTRVRIIAEISSAVCFLHSSQPDKIVHGDLKPQNILLDSELSCKICEFGICRLVTEDTLYSPRFHRITEPKGAFPYVDPESSRIGVLTPKSDIYSFGVIILQLLTGKAPVGLIGEVRRTMSHGKLASILDPSAGEWPMLVVKRLMDLALQFCELNSKDRPDLTPSLVRELEQLHVSEERPVPSYFLCPILQEIMHDPQVAADGFTYEGEALRGWLENGRETSPMTNLRLNHLRLTPNHALRIAIQDWLCKC